MFVQNPNTTFNFGKDTIAVVLNNNELTWSQYGFQTKGPNILINFDHRIFELQRDITTINELSF